MKSVKSFLLIVGIFMSRVKEVVFGINRQLVECWIVNIKMIAKN
jgi:hypothetical protein